MTACPDPGLPHWWTVPNVSRIGSTRSMVSASPPAMTARVPAAAPCGPPLTGQSRATMPRSAAASASSIAVAGPIVEASMSTDPVRMTSRSPPDPVHTSRTSSGPGRQVTTTSVAASAAATASGSRPASSRAGSRGIPRWLGDRPSGAPSRPAQPTRPSWFGEQRTCQPFLILSITQHTGATAEPPVSGDSHSEPPTSAPLPLTVGAVETGCCRVVAGLLQRR